MGEVLVESGISLHLCGMSGKTNILGLVNYLRGASNSRKRSLDSTARAGQPVEDDAEVEDAGEQ